VSYTLVDHILRTPMDDLTAPEKAVLVYMASHASDDGRKTYPGEQLIAECTGFGKSTVHRATKALRTKGFLVDHVDPSEHVKKCWTPGRDGGSKRIFDIDIVRCGVSRQAPERGQTNTKAGSEKHHSEPQSSTGSDPRTDQSTARPAPDAPAADFILDEVDAVISHFVATRREYGENVRSTAARHRAVAHALRRGYTVDECRVAVTNAHREFCGEPGSGIRYEDGGRLLCDLPHTLDQDRIEAAIRDDWPLDWGELRSDRMRVAE
jgi:hypothetical protein